MLMVINKNWCHVNFDMIVIGPTGTFVTVTMGMEDVISPNQSTF